MGPLQGLRVIEIAGIGPGPFCGMLLADMGADVVSVTRRSADPDSAHSPQVSERGKRSVAIDLKHPKGVEIVLKLCESSDVLIEGFRPGVAERLGIGPEMCLARNPSLIYGRMTGWGQTGPLAHAAGHDINYIALSGALHAIGHAGGKPVPPLNLVGDFGGGGMLLAFGILCAIYEASSSGRGQVVDAAMVEGSATLMHMMYSFMGTGTWSDNRGTNLLDSGAFFYDTYETQDAKFIAIGAIEPQFYTLLLDKLGLDTESFNNQWDTSRWPELKQALASVIKTRTRDQWCELLEGTDVCFAPVLSMREAPQHPHNRARNSFIELGGIVQPAPAPRFDRTPASVRYPAHPAGIDTDTVLEECGYGNEQIRELRKQRVLT